MTKPISASATSGFAKSPRATFVESFETMMFAFCSPMKATNRPMPAEIPFFRFAGIPLMICSRILNSDIMMKMIPSTKTAVRAMVNAFFAPPSSPWHTVYAKYAFRPRPAESAIG